MWLGVKLNALNGTFYSIVYKGKLVKTKVAFNYVLLTLSAVSGDLFVL